MSKINKLFANHGLALQFLSFLAFTVALITANSRCAYIFHDPKKTEELKQLRKF